MRETKSAVGCLLVFLMLSGLPLVGAAEARVTLTISAPVSLQVFQRDAQDHADTITEALNRDCGYPLPWFVAQASFHPDSKEPEQREVAKGQQMLWKKKVAFQGPITDDLLGAKYRSDGVHFNQAGLDAHAQRWFDALRKQHRWKSK